MMIYMLYHGLVYYVYWYTPTSSNKDGIICECLMMEKKEVNPSHITGIRLPNPANPFILNQTFFEMCKV